MNHLSKMDRRAFMGAAVSAAYAVNAVPNTVFGATAPSNKLNVAMIIRQTTLFFFMYLTPVLFA